MRRTRERQNQTGGAFAGVHTLTRMQASCRPPLQAGAGTAVGGGRTAAGGVPLAYRIPALFTQNPSHPPLHSQ